MTESVRQQWVYRMHACAAIHGAITSLTGSISLPVISIVEFGEARRQHDLRDMNKFLDWFRSHDPFDGNVPSFVLWPAGWPQVRMMASIVMKQISRQ